MCDSLLRFVAFRCVCELNSSLTDVVDKLNPKDWQYQYVNLNDLKSTGLYTAFAGGNSPFGSNNYFMVLVLAKQSENDTIVQFAFRNNQFYFRMYFGGAWLSWISIAQ